MVKPLSGNDNAKDAPASHATAHTAGGALPWGSRADFAKANGVGAYGAQSTQGSNYSKEAWDKKQPWNSGPGGRLAIRLFSRGILGCMFYSAGNLLTTKWLETSGNVYRPEDPFFRDAKYLNKDGSYRYQNNPLKVVSKLIDEGIGAPIEFTVKNFSRHVMGKSMTEAEALGARAVTFRETRQYGKLNGAPRFGRSLGHESSSVTFDFFCASVGDAFGRDIVAFLDPKIRYNQNDKERPQWLDKNGHIKATGALKQLIRYVTLNGGEDWAVGVAPYLYYMKAQRAVINHYYPGFKYDFDHGLNGGSFKVDDELKITGDYQLAGAIDLQGRFVAYNMGTLMFREAYSYMQGKWEGHSTPLYGAPDKAPAKGIVNKMEDIGKWMARDIIKAGIYMTPVTPIFCITRGPQRKHNGLFINGNKGFVSAETDYGRRPLRPDQAILDNPEFKFSRYDGNFVNEDGIPYRRSRAKDYIADGKIKYTFQKSLGFEAQESQKFDAYKHGDKMTDAIGQASAKIRDTIAKPFAWLDEKGGRYSQAVKEALGIKGKEGNPASLTTFSKIYTNALLSYTPYMYAKAEAANWFDNGKTDMAIERTVNGVAQLKLGESIAGLGEIGRAMFRLPLKDAKRQQEAKHRLEMDETPPEDSDRSQHEYDRDQAIARDHAASWGDRILIGRRKTQDRPAHKKDENKAPSYAEQEAARKALLDELNPPTNSIH